MPDAYPNKAKVLIDAMQAQKAFGPSAAATRAAGPSALAMARTAGLFDGTQRPGAALAEALKPISAATRHPGAAKLAEALKPIRAPAPYPGGALAAALKPIGGAAQHGAVAKLVAGFKPVGTVAGAAENLRRATDGFANGSRGARMIPSSTGRSLAALFEERDAALSERPFPRVEPLPNYNAELLKLQRQIEARRAEERQIEDERHEQSLTVQRAMHAALVESEAARAADAEAAALREQALVDRAEAGDKRESRLLRLTVASVCVAVLVPLVQFVLPLI